MSVGFTGSNLGVSRPTVQCDDHPAPTADAAINRGKMQLGGWWQMQPTPGREKETGLSADLAD